MKKLLIIPAYNEEKNIENTIKKLLALNNPDIDYIIINDGSTDNSEEVIKEYIKNQKRQELIKYYAKQNEGIAKTRNFGVEKATSEYIMFVDSDDYLDKNFCKKIEKYIKSTWFYIKKLVEFLL